MGRVSKEILRRREYQRAYYAKRAGKKSSKVISQAKGKASDTPPSAESFANTVIKALIGKLSAALATR